MQTATELRNELADVFQQVKNGTMPIEQAEALSNIAGKMIASALAQVKHNHVSKSHQEIPWLQEPKPVIEFVKEIDDGEITTEVIATDSKETSKFMIF